MSNVCLDVNSALTFMQSPIKYGSCHGFLLHPCNNIHMYMMQTSAFGCDCCGYTFPVTNLQAMQALILD